ncbi:MAG TPA: alcohol dehydrogenase catalytic domain-containing protein, partial [Gemmataceae bacterium]|nr:alcohol dehydrogenase catalytic domain-containing protein [Gemmataceae bacterium]
MSNSDIRAAVFDGPGKPFRFEAFPRPSLRAGEALVRVSACTICGSDLHTVAGRRSGPTPCVLGHEPVGVVEEVAGELRDTAGEPVRAGDRVTWAVAASCGQCFFCTRGLPQKCQTLRKYGHEAISPNFGPLGGLTTHCHLIPGTAVVKVPAGVPDAVAAPAGCATATVAAVLAAASPDRQIGGSSVVVFGLGMLGLTACAMAACGGASSVVACDVDDTRLPLAARFGATHAVKLPAGRAELLERTKSLTAGRGADLALELSGSPAAAELSIEVLRVGGTAVWVGAVSP